MDTKRMELRLPQDKLATALDKVNDMCKRKRVQLRNLQSLLGLLSFCCKAIVPGRAFLRRLFDLTRGVTQTCHYIRLNQQSRADLKAWKIFLLSFNGRILILPSATTTSDHLALRTDAFGWHVRQFIKTAGFSQLSLKIGGMSTLLSKSFSPLS